MNIDKIELINFRNYEKYVLENLKQLNFIIGKNATGKTSILEAIYFASLTKSFKGSNEKTLIKQDKESLKVNVNINQNNISKKLQIILNSTGKRTKINNTKKKRLSDYISCYKVILYSPDEIKIIKDSPSIRRNYFNIEISQIYKDYLKQLNNYNILIKNKNEYLKKLMLNNNLDKRYLDVLDEKISMYGKNINNYRKEYIDKINKYIEPIFRKYKPNDSIKINYISDFNDKKETEILKTLHKNRIKDINYGITNFGIHRDDYEFIHNGMMSKDYSSQGLQKLIILSLKFSELNILIKDYYYSPILLLDDLFSELDEQNQNYVIKSIDKKIQTFITTTDLNNINKNIIKNAKIIGLKER